MPGNTCDCRSLESYSSSVVMCPKRQDRVFCFFNGYGLPGRPSLECVPGRFWEVNFADIILPTSPTEYQVVKNVQLAPCPQKWHEGMWSLVADVLQILYTHRQVGITDTNK